LAGNNGLAGDEGNVPEVEAERPAQTVPQLRRLSRGFAGEDGPVGAEQTHFCKGSAGPPLLPVESRKDVLWLGHEHRPVK